MKKLFLLTVSVFICILFCGCTDFRADVGIDKDCNAYIKYHAEMDFSNVEPEYKQSIRDGLTYFCDYYEEKLGFTVEQNLAEDKDAVNIDLTYLSKCDTYSQAFDELKRLLTDPKYTPFITVAMDSSTAKYEAAYSFAAETDLDKILATSGYEDYPKHLQEMFSSGIAEAKGHFSVTLPATAIVESKGDTSLDGNFCTEKVPLTFNEPITLKLTTRLSQEDNSPAAVSTDESIKQIRSSITLYKVLAVVFGILSIVSGVLFAVHLKKRKAYDTFGNRTYY